MTLCKESSDLVQSDLSNPPVLTADHSMNLHDEKNKTEIYISLQSFILLYNNDEDYSEYLYVRWRVCV